jgi:hypothetical protein
MPNRIFLTSEYQILFGAILWHARCVVSLYLFALAIRVWRLIGNRDLRRGFDVIPTLDLTLILMSDLRLTHGLASPNFPTLVLFLVEGAELN